MIIIDKKYRTFSIFLSILIFSILIAGCIGGNKDSIINTGDLPGFTRSMMVNSNSEKIIAFSAKNGDGFIITQIKLNDSDDPIKMANSLIDNSSVKVKVKLVNYSEKNTKYIELEKIGDYSFSTMKINSDNDMIDASTIFIKGKNLIKILSLNGNKSLDSSIRLARIAESRIRE